MGVTRQAVYQSEQRQRQRQQSLEPVQAMVLEIRRRLPRLGTRKLYYLLKPQLEQAGIKLGRDGLFACLRQQHLLIKPLRSYTKTTLSRHWMRKYPNLLKEIAITRPEQVFVSDITYVESAQGVHYLSLVTDACSRKIMGHELSHEMKASDTVKALQQAVAQRQTDAPLLHHSDRGLQYCSTLYQSELAEHNIRPSMTDGYDCYQNALAERVNGILKQEFLLYRCQTFAELNVLVRESVQAYNQLRPHLSLGMKTPEEVHEKASCAWQLAESKPVNVF
jgi:putative transposase